MKQRNVYQSPQSLIDLVAQTAAPAAPVGNVGVHIYTGDLAKLRARFIAGTGGSDRDAVLGAALLARLAAAHDGSQDGIRMIVPWAEWDGYAWVVNDW